MPTSSRSPESTLARLCWQMLCFEGVLVFLAWLWLSDVSGDFIAYAAIPVLIVWPVCHLFALVVCLTVVGRSLRVGQPHLLSRRLVTWFAAALLPLVCGAVGLGVVWFGLVG